MITYDLAGLWDIDYVEGFTVSYYGGLLLNPFYFKLDLEIIMGLYQCTC